jgi:DNA modification methylase
MLLEQSRKLSNHHLVNTITNGDCLNLLRELPSASIDFVLTDPPYLVNYKSRDGRTIANDNDDAWLKPAFRQLFRVLRQNSFCISFYGWNKADKFIAAWREAGFRLSGHITFPKRYASAERFLRYQHENAYLLTKGQPERPPRTIPDVLEWTFSGNNLHPTQKPLSILKPLIQCFTNRGDVVLDPFSGSGSVALAAKLSGRHYIGMELDKDYCELAQRRLARSPLGCAA